MEAGRPRNFKASRIFAAVEAKREAEDEAESPACGSTAVNQRVQETNCCQSNLRQEEYHQIDQHEGYTNRNIYTKVAGLELDAVSGGWDVD